MSSWHSERPDIRHYVDRAHEARAEAVARFGYLAVAAAGRLLDAAIGATQATLEALQIWRDRRAAAQAILRLDDRMLRDIGLTRADAWAAVDGTLSARLQDWPPESTAYTDIAFGDDAVAGCNDNGGRRRAA